MFPDGLSSPPIVAGAAAAAIKATAPELIGDEAPSNAPIPAPLPNTTSTPGPSVSLPILGNALGAAK